MSFPHSGPILLAGAGKMGTALLKGWLGRGLAPEHVHVQEPNLSDEAAQIVASRGIEARPEFLALPHQPAVIVVAVKPQAMDDVFPKLAKLAGQDTVVLSIAAGKTIESFEKHLPQGTAVVRSMPNTPAAIGRGISAAVGNARLTPAQKDICNSLLGAVGDVVWLDDESLIDAVTAVSGSGPAYVFLLTEALAKAGEAAGLDADTAMRLARATVSGSGELLGKAAASPSDLRHSVTSPDGTTAAALAVLQRDPNGLQDLMTEAVLAAKKRGRELGR